MKPEKIASMALAMTLAGGFLTTASPAQSKKPGGKVVVAAVTAPTAIAAKPPSPSKRVWTNEDFGDSSAAEAASEPAGNPASAQKAAETAAKPKEDGPELGQARREVLDEMLATARAREKSYDDTIGLMKARLEVETNSFRAQVYQQILDDTLALKQINRHVLERFENRPEAAGAGAPEPAEAESH